METTDQNNPQQENQKAQKPAPEKQQDNSGKDNIIYVGSKHLMNYVNSIALQFKNSPEVIIKARGKFISKAVDIVEVARRRAEDGPVNIKDIKIATEEYDNEGKKVKVSTIDIMLTR